jgi:hypothetical protein
VRSGSIVDNALYALTQMDYIEVEEQTKRFVGQLEVGQELSCVDRERGFNTLELNNNNVFDQQINAIPASIRKPSY